MVHLWTSRLTVLLLTEWLLNTVAAVKSTAAGTQRIDDICAETRKVEVDIMTVSKQREAFAAADTTQGTVTANEFIISAK